MSVTKNGTSLAAWHDGDQKRVAVAVAQFALLCRARKVRANATVVITTECTAPLSSVHEDPAPSPLYIEKGLASHPGLHAEVPNKRAEQAHAGDNPVLRSDLALETPQRPHATSGLTMPIAQRSVRLIVLLERLVFDAQRVFVDGGAHEIVQHVTA